MLDAARESPPARTAPPHARTAILREAAVSGKGSRRYPREPAGAHRNCFEVGAGVCRDRRRLGLGKSTPPGCWRDCIRRSRSIAIDDATAGGDRTRCATASGSSRRRRGSSRDAARQRGAVRTRGAAGSHRAAAAAACTTPSSRCLGLRHHARGRGSSALGASASACRSGAAAARSGAADPRRATSALDTATDAVHNGCARSRARHRRRSRLSTVMRRSDSGARRRPDRGRPHAHLTPLPVYSELVPRKKLRSLA